MLVRLSSLNFLPIRLSAFSTSCWEPGRQKSSRRSVTEIYWGHMPYEKLGNTTRNLLGHTNNLQKKKQKSFIKHQTQTVQLF